ETQSGYFLQSFLFLSLSAWESILCYKKRLGNNLSGVLSVFMRFSLSVHVSFYPVYAARELLVLDQQLVDLIPELEGSGKEVWLLSEGKGILWRYAVTHQVDPELFSTWWVSNAPTQPLTNQVRLFYD